MCEDASEAFCEWRGRNERGGLAGSVFIRPVQPHTVVTREHSVHVFHPYTVIMRERSVQRSHPIHPHTVTRVSVVFSVLVLLTHILASHVSVSEQCSVLCVLNLLLS